MAQFPISTILAGIFFLSSLSPSLSAKAKVHEALKFDLDLSHISLKPFYKGFYGKVGASTLFVASKKEVPDEARVYWAIVQVLSKKYGCFIRRKAKKGPYRSFLCKDKRIIVFHNRSTKNHILFSGRQFDQKGREIVVNNHKVVGRYPIFENSFPTRHTSR